jgi:hypothetical protein
MGLLAVSNYSRILTHLCHDDDSSSKISGMDMDVVHIGKSLIYSQIRHIVRLFVC